MTELGTPGGSCECTFSMCKGGHGSGKCSKDAKDVYWARQGLPAILRLCEGCRIATDEPVTRSIEVGPKEWFLAIDGDDFVGIYARNIGEAEVLAGSIPEWEVGKVITIKRATEEEKRKYGLVEI